jgi:N-acetylmuramoyl-L-alanine amidase
LLGNIDKLKTSSRRINEIIVHCSATREGRDYTVADITKWHKQRGFNDIGYHYVIYRDGSLHNGRDVNLVGAHCTNHNAHSIGVCYIGGCKTDGTSPKDTRTDAQKAALLSLLKDLRKKYPFAKIHGHRDFANKACPSFDATNEYKNI